jgi:2-methylisocitrate lyase-like PEP mutase family enzyme
VSASAAATTLRALHAGPAPLVVPNVWDAASARVFADAGFPALATTSTAVAATLGYADGEQAPRAQMFAAIARIAAAVDVPVTADIEAGYGLEPAELVDQVLATGVVGANLEDSIPASRTLVDVDRQADRLAAVRAAAGDALVLNARIDVFIAAGGRERPAADTLADAVERGRAYRAAGADCVYPIFAPAELLPEPAGRIGGPVNVMYRPGGPSIAELVRLGATRITFGGGLHAQVLATARQLADSLHAELRALRP